MAEQTRPHVDQQAPNPASQKEVAEGERETVEGNAQRSAGITNRPLDEEQEEQGQLPPRGQSKRGSHA